MGFTSDAEDRILLKRVEEAIGTADEKGYPRFVGFLDERERAVVSQYVRHLRADSTSFYGGHAQAERTVFGAFPSHMPIETDLFPLCAVAFLCRNTVRLDHRAVLGTIMSLGVKRDKIGDILCDDGIAVVFADEAIAPFLAEQITKIGGEGVNTKLGYDGALPTFHRFAPVRTTIASARLDVVVKALLNCSREEASRRILSGTVMLNHIPTLHSSESVKQGDVLSVRGNGRYVLDEIGPPTHKGRLVLTARKYI